MQIDYIPKDHAEKLISTIIELRPSMKIRIQAEDTALFMLGLSKSILCSVVIDENEDSILSLIDEVYQMEVDAFNFDEKELVNTEYAKCQQILEQKYLKYAIILEYLGA